MYEVNWSLRGHSPDHRPNIFEEHAEALKFLQDELHWQGFDGDKAVSRDVTEAIEELSEAREGEEFTLRIGRYVYWLIERKSFSELRAPL